TPSVAFTLNVTDSGNLSDSKTLTINLVGADDTPTLTASVTSATLTDTAANDAFAAVTGTLSTADRDTGDTATYSITGQTADISQAGFDQSLASTYGTLYLNSASGAYSFLANAGAINALQAGATPSVALTLDVTDSGNLSDSKTLTINLVGADDTPTLTASVTSATLTDTAANDAFAAVTGTLSTAARDTGDTATYSITGQTADISQAGFDQSLASTYGTLYLNSASGAYSFLANAGAINALQAGATPSVAFTLNVTDSGNLSDSKTLTINLVGADDTPTLTASVTSATLTDTAANDAFAAVTGTLSTADRDTGDTATYSITGQTADISQAGFDQSLASTYGTLYLNSASGAYSFLANAGAINALQAGATPSVAFTLNVTDSGNLSDSKTLTINLVGADDTPTLTASVTSATLTDTAANDAFAAVTGTLS